jgi:autotransporter-associated beta strand protein
VAWATNYLSTIILAPVEDNDPAFVDPGLENWTVASATMFLAEWVRRSGQTQHAPVLQRAADALANRIQDYQQPPYNGATGPTKLGLMGHGGVVGDYAHIGWTGINIINSHVMAALALAKGAGATVSDYKFQMCWSWVKSCTSTSGGDAGNVGYAWQQGGGDSAGRTAGVYFGMKNYGPSSNDTFLVSLNDYLVRAHVRQQHAHAYTLGGVALYQFALPYLADREQRYIMENWRFYYNLGRQPDGSVAYVGGRENNGGDSYLDFNNVGWVNAAMPMVPASGRVAGFPSPNPARFHAQLTAPWNTWPDLAARSVRVTNTTEQFQHTLTDAEGLPLAAGDYTCQWSQVSGPGSASFGVATAASTSITFPLGGLYRLQFTAVRGGYTLTEWYDCSVIPTPPPAGYVAGQVDFELFTGLSGTTVASLTNAAKYPNSPDVVGTLTRLDHAYGADNYGERIRGYILPPGSGSYRFYIASDDESLFRMNTNGAAVTGLTALCSVPNGGYTDANEWGKYTNQASRTVALTAGQPYYFEALMKEGGGDDLVQVAWTGPGITTQTIIGADYLAVALPSNPAPVVLQQPASATSGLGGGVTFSLRAAGLGPMLYQWRLNGVTYGAAATTPGLTIGNLAAGHAGDYVCVIANPYGVTTSAVAKLVITNVGALVTGGLWRDVYNGIAGSTVATLTNAAVFPRLPDAGGVITNAESPANYAEDFGERWTGWLKPETSGVYRFLLTSDDASELWLSTDQYPANKVKLCSVASYTSARDWTASAKSGYTNLDAGRRYYIEVRHKEGGGADHCALAWQLQGSTQPTNGADPMPGRLFECLSGGSFDDLVIPSVNITNPVASTITVPAGVGLLMEGVVFDDGLPNPPGASTTQWSQVTGPGPVVFGNAAWTNTTAQFPTTGVYVLRLSAYDGAQSGFRELTVNVGAAAATGGVSLAGYSIGSLSTAPGYTLSNGTYRLFADGYDSFYGAYTSDDGYLLAVTVVGDCTVTARITSVGTSPYPTWTRAGVMIRESSAAGARSAFMGLQYGGSRRFTYRTTTGGGNGQSSSTASTIPLWVKLVRTGNVFRAFYSSNGSTWSTQGVSQTISMSTTVLVGLASASGAYTASTNVFASFGIAGTSLGGSSGTNAGNVGPTVSAGPDRTVQVMGGLTLNGAAPDDGKPAAPGAVSVRWVQLGGPAPLTFTPANAATSAVTLAAAGTYTVRLYAADGELTTFDDALLTATGVSVSVTAVDAEAREGSTNTGLFRISRDGASAAPLTVHFALSGTATAGVDYTNLGASVVIAAGTNDAWLTVAPADDLDLEGDETVVLTLATNASYGIGVPGAATVDLIDDETYQPVLRWNGTSNSAWDLTNQPNWYAVSEGLAGQRFSNGNHVVFEDVPGVATVITFAAGQNLLPGSVQVRTDRRFVFAGSAHVQGDARLVKEGAGLLLVVSTSNNLTGPVQISNGVVQVNLAAALGLGDIEVATGGALRVNGNVRLRDQAIRLAGVGPDGTGALCTIGAGDATITGPITLTAPALIGSDLTGLWLSGAVDTVTYPLTFAGTGTIHITNGLLTGSGGITRRGPGTLALHGDQHFSGGVLVQGGTLQLNAGGWQVNPFGHSNHVTILTSAVLRTLGPHALGTDQNHLIIKGGTLQLAAENYLTGFEMFGGAVTGGEIRCDGGIARFHAAGSAATLYSPLRLIGPTTFDVADGPAAADLALRGSLLYDQTLTKEGDGTLLVALNATHAGTFINDGRVQVGEGGTVGSLGGGPVTVNAELVYQLASTVTLHQVIGGAGLIAQAGAGALIFAASNDFAGTLLVSTGSVTVRGWLPAVTTLVAAAGTLSGTGALGGALTLDGQLAVVLGTTGPAGLRVLGDATLGGTLAVTATNGLAFAAGQSFTVLTAAAISGTFTNVVLPALGGGMAWVVDYQAAAVVLAISEPVTVTLSAPDAAAAETGDAGLLRVSRSGLINTPLTVALGYAGDASNGVDVALLPDSVAFAAGQTVTDLVVAAVTDTLSEGAESLQAFVMPATNHLITPPGTAAVAIADTPVDDWRHSWFGTNANAAGAGDLDDADGDGWLNLWEYAQGGNPTTNLPLAPPFLAWSNGVLGFHYQRTTNAAGITWRVLVADEPTGAWYDWPEPAASTAAVAGALIEIRCPLPSNAPASRVMGLQITRP